jgi:DNA-binding Lrp family transcriptional regulator
MPASKKTQDFVANELPYKLLMYLYKNSRAPLKALGREFNISYHTVSEVLRRCEERYGIVYTLQLNEQALGFTEGRVITIKFATMPNIETLKERIKKDTFIQDAYLGSGDFDLLLYVVGLSNRDYAIWQFNFRVEFSEYKPNLKVSALGHYTIGFFPLRNELLAESTVLNDAEKKVLLLLNENSRMKLGEIVKKSKLTQMRVIYIMKKLAERKIIKNYTTLVQKPDKHLLMAYASSHTFVKSHDKLLLKFLEEMTKEDLHEVTNDYALMCNTNGVYDIVFVCTFKDGEAASKRGAEIIKDLWKEEDSKIEKAVLTSLLVGDWPFHLEKYEKQLEDIVAIKKKL